VVAATHRHRFGARMLLTNTDRELIRQCPVPVLLVHTARPYKNPVVVAAVDPFHARAGAANLDQKLIDTGANIAKLLRGTLHVFHSYRPLMSIEAPAAGPPIVMPPEAEKAHEVRMPTWW